MATVLFVCKANAGRSQMSRALFSRATAGARRALSAGGIDLADRRPQPLTPQLAEQADVIVTMGCGDACP
jgi:arsenate reductase (thioredoxin)